MPQTEKGKRNTAVKGGERRAQEAANRVEAAATQTRESSTGRGVNFDNDAVLDPSQVEFREAPFEGTLGTGPQRRGQTERPLGNDEEPGRENRTPAPEGVEFVDGMVDEIPKYADEDEEFLFGATDRPQEPVNAGVTSMNVPPPKNIYQYLAVLAHAAEDPDAPEQIHAFIRVLEDLLAGEE